MRIVGGHEAVPGMFKWLANENRECGATLISCTALHELPSQFVIHEIRTEASDP